jgi:hypothetical protein
MDIDPHYPVAEPSARRALEEAKHKLEAEGPNGDPPDPFEASAT